MLEQFIQWLERELSSREMSQRALARKTGIASSTITYWLAGKHEPDDANIEALARFFEIDRRFLYELLGRMEPSAPNRTTDEEREWLEMLRSMTPDERRKLLGVARGLGFGAKQKRMHQKD